MPVTIKHLNVGSGRRKDPKISLSMSSTGKYSGPGYSPICISTDVTRRFFYLLLLFLFQSCNVSNQLSRLANESIIKDSALLPAHVGIAVFEPAAGRYWYSHQADKYFIPASNTKLFSLYAGLKYLGDSVAAIKYARFKDTLFLVPTGDPTFLHKDFTTHPLFEFLKNSETPLAIINNTWKENALGFGWSWDDYNEEYMPERNALPVYGNVIRWTQTSGGITGANKDSSKIVSRPSIRYRLEPMGNAAGKGFFVKRAISENTFYVYPGKETGEQEVPFITNGIASAITFLGDTLKKSLTSSSSFINQDLTPLYSQSSDSLFKTMMHRSDNFFAEQTLLMVSNEKLGYMNDKAVIDSILHTDLYDIPHLPTWVDGSGLSRYNLFTPADFIYILNKMKNEFGFERLKNILPTGGAGTLKRYYLQDSGFVYAKTGTLSNNGALSGFIITKRNKLLIFSILSNNFVTEAVAFRKAAEKFLTRLREQH